MHHIPFETAQVFIAGRWRPCVRGGRLMLVNPSDGQPLAEIARGDAADVHAAVTAAQAALDGTWGGLTATERGRLLHRMSTLVLEQADELARLEALDVGSRSRRPPRGRPGPLSGVLRWCSRQGDG